MPGETAGPNAWAGVWLTIGVLAVSAGALIVATGFVPATTRYFPLAVSAACIVVALADVARRATLGRRIRAARKAGSAPDRPEIPPIEFVNRAAEAPLFSVLRYAVWFFGYLAGIWVLSLVVASGLFVCAFLRLEAKVSWWASGLSGAMVIGLVIIAGDAFNTRWPNSLLDPLGFLV